MANVEDRKQVIKQAVEAGDLGRLIFLLEIEERICIDLAAKHCDEALMYALVAQKGQIFEYLLAHGAVVDIYLIGSLSWGSLKLLVASSWDINTILPSGGTLLWSFLQFEKYVKYLLDHGADPNVGNRADSLDPIDLSLSTDHPSDVLERAAIHATPSVMNLLIAHGAQPEKSLIFHKIAVMGSLEGNPDRLHAMVEYLQAIGLDINEGLASNARPDHLFSPLDIAITFDNLDMVRLLLEHGAWPGTNNWSSALARCYFPPKHAMVDVLEIFERSYQQDPEAMQELFGTEPPPEQPHPIVNSEDDESLPDKDGQAPCDGSNWASLIQV